MYMLLSMSPSALSVSAPLIISMVVTIVLSSYQWTYPFIFQLTPYGLAIVSLLLFPAFKLLLDCYYVWSLLFPFFLLFPV